MTTTGHRDRGPIRTLVTFAAVLAVALIGGFGLGSVLGDDDPDQDQPVPATTTTSTEHGH